MAQMTSEVFTGLLLKIAKETPTLYVNGCFGAPLTGENVERYCRHTAYNQKPARSAMIRAAGDKTPPVFGFDCVCLIKGVLWGWCGDAAKTYGGAVYRSNGVEDMTLDTMIESCTGLSSDFSAVEPGEAVWMPGHIGVYIGDGLAVECTPAWDNGVQITACNCSKAGYHRRDWKKHGKLPYISYPEQAKECSPTLPVLRRGMTGDAVRALQAILIGKFGISCGESGIDGSFGPATEAALKAFRKQAGLAQGSAVDAACWEKLIG